MTKTECLQDLFKNWKTEFSFQPGDFYRDGIINEELYNQCPVGKKVLVIAKEPNAIKHERLEDGDFVTEWNSCTANYPLAYRISEWIFGILNDFPPFDNIPKNSTEFLKRIAFMNVKKSGGKGYSEKNDIYIVVEKQYQNIIKEIEIIDPDIVIICVGFDKMIISAIFPTIKFKESGYAIQVAGIGKRKIINFYHPSSRNVASASYSLLQNVIQSRVFQNLLIES